MPKGKNIISLSVSLLIIFVSGTAQALNDEVKKIDAVAREIQALQLQLNAANEKVRMLYKKQTPLPIPIKQTKLNHPKPALNTKNAKRIPKK